MEWQLDLPLLLVSVRYAASIGWIIGSYVLAGDCKLVKRPKGRILSGDGILDGEHTKRVDDNECSMEYSETDHAFSTRGSFHPLPPFFLVSIASPLLLSLHRPKIGKAPPLHSYLSLPKVIN